MIQAESLEKTAPRKRKASHKITDKNFVGTESNVVTKRLKLSADAARAASLAAKRKPSVQDDDDDEDTLPLNIPPKNPQAILEAADGSDDSDVEMLDKDPAPEDSVADEPEVAETDEEQLGESN